MKNKVLAKTKTKTKIVGQYTKKKSDLTENESKLSHFCHISDALCTKIDMYNEGMRNLMANNTQKVFYKLAEMVNEESTQKTEKEASNAKWRQDLERSLKKTLFDSFKEMTNVVKYMVK